MFKEFTEVAQPQKTADWQNEMEKAFQAVELQDRLNVIAMQHAMTCAFQAGRQTEASFHQGLRRFLNPVSDKTDCGRDRQTFKAHMERMFA